MSRKRDEKEEVKTAEELDNTKDEDLEQEQPEQEENSNLIDELKEELNKQKDLFLRTAAEYENYRKRSQREKTAVYNDATADTIEAILPIVDSLEQALKSTDGANDDYKKGLELIKAQLDTSFEKLGIKSIGEAGEEFDPNFHNAVMHIEDDTIADNTIVEVFQKGYVLSERVIRHAMVKVAN